MGCDIDYSGLLEKNNLQVKVVRFSSSFYKERKHLYVKPIPDKTFLTEYEKKGYLTEDYKYVGFPSELIRVPFNFFGSIPLFDDSYDLQGQFIFDRNNGGELVTLSKLPIEFNCTAFPPNNIKNDLVEVRVKEDGNLRAIGEASAFCLMLRIIALRWWPELEVSDDYDNYKWVSTFLAGTTLEKKLLNERLDFDACLELFNDEYDFWFPPRQHFTEPAKPVVRIVPPNALEIPITELELSIRSATALKRLQIKTAGELIAYSPKELLKIKNCGRRSVREIQGVLEDIGLYLRKDPDE